MASTDNNWQKSNVTNVPNSWVVQRVAETGSTNTDLFEAAQNGARHHTALMADNQTAGRGRRDRTWEAQSGANLLVSLLFRESHSEISLCQRVVAVSAVRACRKFIDDYQPAISPIKLKWPNDLLLHEKKFGGMLSVAAVDQTFIVVGIGINISWAPEYAAKLNDLELKQLVEPVDVLRVLLEHIDVVEKLTTQQLYDEYVGLLSTLNKVVRVELTNGNVISGRATSLDANGRLIIETGDEKRSIDTGDVVHLRDANHE
ncbi:MAG: biotin--[acetyl-CoA-carboxylase] ligase [Acidimicrobiaceae bacterium]